MMSLFQRKPKCPTCGSSLKERPRRKQKCPHCGAYILVRSGELVGEDQAQTIDWLGRLEAYGIAQKDFDKTRKQLSRQFGGPASVNDTVWRILNSLVAEFASDAYTLEGVYRLQSALLSSEGKDPTSTLVEAERVRQRQQVKRMHSSRQVFLGHDELAYVRRLRSSGKLDEAVTLLRKAEPSPAVLDELRKAASTRARAARKSGDWAEVIKHLESYLAYADKWRDYCVETVNEEPPSLTSSETKLLEKAKQKLADK